MADDKIALQLHVHAETNFAIEVSRKGAISEATWLPKSLVQYDEPLSLGTMQTVRLTRALAEARRLL